MIGASLADLPALKPYGRFGLGVTAGVLAGECGAVIALAGRGGPAAGGSTDS